MMGRSIYTASLADLLPEAMASNNKVKALCAALDVMSKAVTDSIASVIILGDIGNQPSEITDYLAIEQQTPYYDQSLPLEKKQSLVASSGRLNSIRGTKKGVKELTEIVFGPSQISEWFEYSGDPFHFSIYVSNEDVPGEKIVAFTAMLEEIKNKRSVLDAIIIGVQGSWQYYQYRGKTWADLSAYTWAELAAGITFD